MGYERSEWLLRTQSATHNTLNAAALPLLHRATDNLYLKQLLRRDEEALYALTCHQFASRFIQKARPSPPTFSETQRSIEQLLLPYEHSCQFFLTQKHMRVCPHCLDEKDGYDRLYWRCEPLLICPRHSVLLVSHCPSCRALIPALRPSLTLCPSCHISDYRTALFPLLREEHRLESSQSLLMRQLGIDDTEI